MMIGFSVCPYVDLFVSGKYRGRERGYANSWVFNLYGCGISHKLKAGHYGWVMNYVPFDVVKYAMNILDKDVPVYDGS